MKSIEQQLPSPKPNLKSWGVPFLTSADDDDAESAAPPPPLDAAAVDTDAAFR